MTLPPGFAVGEYRIEAELGRGGMGVVYSALQPVIGRRVAVKVLSAAAAGSPELLARFVDEARASSRIGHPNIINVFAFGALGDGRPYSVMEYLEGETLERRLARGPLSTAELVRFVTQICRALTAAHDQGIIHRDLKPENIWIASPPHTEPFVKVLDFGIAKLSDPSRPALSLVGVPIGTPLYMSPEQCLGQPVDARTDVYALGVILFRNFTGRFPFEGATFADVVLRHVSEPAPPASAFCPMDPGLERLLASCLEKDPERRPPSMLELAERLAALFAPGAEREGDGNWQPTLRNAGKEAPPRAGSARARPQASRRALAFLALASLVAVGSAFVHPLPRSAEKPEPREVRALPRPEPSSSSRRSSEPLLSAAPSDASTPVAPPRVTVRELRKAEGERRKARATGLVLDNPYPSASR